MDFICRLLATYILPLPHRIVFNQHKTAQHERTKWNDSDAAFYISLLASSCCITFPLSPSPTEREICFQLVCSLFRCCFSLIFLFFFLSEWATLSIDEEKQKNYASINIVICCFLSIVFSLFAGCHPILLELDALLLFSSDANWENRMSVVQWCDMQFESFESSRHTYPTHVIWFGKFVDTYKSCLVLAVCVCVPHFPL